MLKKERKQSYAINIKGGESDVKLKTELTDKEFRTILMLARGVNNADSGRHSPYIEIPGYLKR